MRRSEDSHCFQTAFYSRSANLRMDLHTDKISDFFEAAVKRFFSELELI